MKASVLFILVLLATNLFAEIRVEDVSALYPLPMEATVLRLAPANDDALQFRITDFCGKEVLHSNAVRAGDKFELRYALPQGYYEIELLGRGQRIGIAVYPLCDAPKEGYWCVDSGLTWCGWSLAWKKKLVEILLSRGIASFRERMSWHSTKECSNLANSNTVKLRQDIYPQGRILELLHDSPSKWRRGNHRNSFDFDLNKGAAGLKNLEALVGDRYSAVELWNEPFYNDGLPADQYIPVAKMMGSALKSRVVGGCFTPAVSANYLRQCCESGFLGLLDALSLHSYSAPEAMPETIRYFRETLAKYGAGNLRLWITESGTPGSADASTGRALSARDDIKNAVTTAMRAIECNALGVERFYAFYLQQYIEGKIAWGLCDRIGSAQRGIAAYLAAASLIGQRQYCGDIKMADDELICHVFSDERTGVLVIYGQQGKDVELPESPIELRGADGRLLHCADNTVTNYDGLLYAIYPSEALTSLVHRDTLQMNLRKMAHNDQQERIQHKLIIQPCYPDKQVISHSNNGYVITPENASRYTASAWVSNFSSDAMSVKVSLHLSDGTREEQQLEIQAESNAQVNFAIDFRGALEQNESVQLRWECANSAGDDADWVVQYFSRPPQVRRQLVRYASVVPVTDGIYDDVWNDADAITDTAVYGELPDELKIPQQEFSSTARFLWSDLGLHFLVRVSDREHEPAESDGDSWRYDSLQLAISQYNSANDHNRFEWGFFLDDKGESRHTAFMTSTGRDLSRDSAIAIRRDDNAGITWYEGLIAWNDLGSMNAIYNRNGLRMRLTFCVNDHNQGNRRWSQWSPGIASGKNMDEAPEITLTKDSRQVILLPLQDGRFAGEQSAYSVDDTQIKMADVKNCRLEFAIDKITLERPIALRFDVAATEWSKHGGTGFSFMAGFANRDDNEKRECWMAPSKMYGGRSGYAVYEVNSPAPALNEQGKCFSPDSKFHTYEFILDPIANKMVLNQINADGSHEKLVEGNGIRGRMSGCDQIYFKSSGWGAGPFLLRNIELSY